MKLITRLKKYSLIFHNDGDVMYINNLFKDNSISFYDYREAHNGKTLSLNFEKEFLIITLFGIERDKFGYRHDVALKKEKFKFKSNRVIDLINSGDKQNILLGFLLIEKNILDARY